MTWSYMALSVYLLGDVHDFPSDEVLCIELEEKISLNNNNHYLFVIVIMPYHDFELFDEG